MHLFLSPHADDAALSCGGQIVQLALDGEQVKILTVMAGDPPPNFKPTAFTRELAARWKIGDRPVAARREEDQAAAQSLGAVLEFGDYPDAVYRVNPQTGEALYSDEASIFGQVQANDPLLPVSQIALPTLAPDVVVHAPLAAGHHVDHIIVRDLAACLAVHYPENKFYFYEDYPYVSQDKQAIRAALHQFNQPMMRVTRRLSSRTLEAKIAAVACYQSQISSFWDSPETMTAQLSAAAQDGEGEWRLLRGKDL